MDMFVESKMAYRTWVVPLRASERVADSSAKTLPYSLPGDNQATSMVTDFL